MRWLPSPLPRKLEELRAGDTTKESQYNQTAKDSRCAQKRAPATINPQAANRSLCAETNRDAMKTSLTTTLAALLLTLSSGLCSEDAPKPLYPQYPSETPPSFTPVTDTWEYDL